MDSIANPFAVRVWGHHVRSYTDAALDAKLTTTPWSQAKIASS